MRQARHNILTAMSQVKSCLSYHIFRDFLGIYIRETMEGRSGCPRAWSCASCWHRWLWALTRPCFITIRDAYRAPLASRSFKKRDCFLAVSYFSDDPCCWMGFIHVYNIEWDSLAAYISTFSSHPLISTSQSRSCIGTRIIIQFQSCGSVGTPHLDRLLASQKQRYSLSLHFLSRELLLRLLVG